MTESQPRILVTNDDGIDSPGLHAMVAAVAPFAQVMVVAPDRNRSAVSRSITLGQTLSVEECEVEGACVALATDGTPTDCVRLAALGLAGERPDLVVSGANHGLNLGDDVTYSGTVAAAFEGAMMGIPALAVSQQSIHRELGFKRGAHYDFTSAQRVVAQIARRLLAGPLGPGIVLSINVPGLPPELIAGVEATVLGRRIYRDKLELTHETDGKRFFSLYGDDPSHHEEQGTDIAAIGRDTIAVTPIHFDLSCRPARETVHGWQLDLGAEGDGQ